MKLKFKKLHANAIIPRYQTSGSAGFDFHSVEYADIEPKISHSVKTGLSVEVPEGYELQVRQRSGLSMTYCNYLSNCVGTIDSDFRGEIYILIYNHSNKVFSIAPGDRIAQGIIAPVIQCEIEEVKELSATKRGIRGWGSTGVS